MPSPFPGMDPYLERHWLDVHARLVAYAADELNRILPEHLVARVEERVAVESGFDQEHLIAPDVRVVAPASADREKQPSLTIDAPYKLVLEVDPLVERFIRIIDDSGRLVTVVEFLSPTNKRQPGLKVYREKRQDLLEASVSVVEIDLVRAGDWRALLRPHLAPPDAVAEYRVVVRVPPGTTAFLFPASLRTPLPDVPIPLDPSLDKPMLPLQRLVNDVYMNGRYGRTLDYSEPLEPPLAPADQQWLEAQVKSRQEK